MNRRKQPGGARGANIDEAAGGARMSAPRPRVGIFSPNAIMTPANVRAWLLAARTEIGWTVIEAAKAAEIAADDLAALEATGETEGRCNALKDLAWHYLKALLGESFTCLDYDNHPLALFGDKITCGTFEVGNVLRRRRLDLGLSIAEVAARTQDDYCRPSYLERIEWGQPIDSGNLFGRLGAALGIPAVEILRLNGDFSTEDLDEWFAWREAQRRPATHTRSSARRPTKRTRKAA